MNYLALLVATAVLVLQFDVTPALAAQLNWDAIKSPDSPKFTFQRTVTIEYPDGGALAKIFQGQRESVLVTAMVDQIITDKINGQLSGMGSNTRVSGIHIVYSAELVGDDESASIDYKVVLTPKLDGFVHIGTGVDTSAYFDTAWRGIKIGGPIILSDGTEDIDAGAPSGFLQIKFAPTYEKMAGTDAEKILGADLIDATGILLPLAEWHALFDPTAVIVDAKQYGFKGDVVTTLSIEPSTIFRRTPDKVSEAEFTLDKRYLIRSTEAADSANMLVPGYARSTIIGQYELISASPNNPFVSSDPRPQFPLSVLYGMAAVGAVAAIGFFLWSGRKAKKEAESGQTGIDPKHLRGISTSEASGAYHTNRGESHLVDDHKYDKTTSVYEKKP